MAKRLTLNLLNEKLTELGYEEKLAKTGKNKFFFEGGKSEQFENANLSVTKLNVKGDLDANIEFFAAELKLRLEAISTELENEPVAVEAVTENAEPSWVVENREEMDRKIVDVPIQRIDRAKSAIPFEL